MKLTSNTAKESQSGITRRVMKLTGAERGVSDAKDWVASTDLAIVRSFLDGIAVGRYRSARRPWIGCPTFFSELCGKLDSEGPLYAHGFIHQVTNEYQAFQQPLMVARHTEGLADGRHWAENFGNSEQIERLRGILADRKYTSLFLHCDCRGYPTPAHFLVVTALGDAYPVDENDELLDDCEEFRNFWEPYLAIPIDTVMAELNRPELLGTYKLQDANYVLGFIDGALGLSEQLLIRLSRRRLMSTV